MAQPTVHLDAQHRAHVYLEAGSGGPDHDVLIESMRPIVEGFCLTCFDDWRATAVASRKARACQVMAGYLGTVNRDRRLAADLRAHVESLTPL